MQTHLASAHHARAPESSVAPSPGKPVSASAGRSRDPLRRLAGSAVARAPWLLDAYRLARDPLPELVLRRDLAHTRASASFLRDVSPPSPGSPVALVALYRDYVFETKLDLLLASALRLQGIEPVISVPRSTAHRVRRYARAFGVERVIAQDTLTLTPDERTECARAHAALTSGELSFDSVRAWTFRGFAIGTHVLSTLIRVTFDGAPDLSLPANRDRAADILDDVLVNVIRAERLVRDLSPRVLLVQEANYSTNGPIVDVAVRNGIDVVQTALIWRDDALVSKRLTEATRRVDAKSVAAETLSRVQGEISIAERDTALDADAAARYGGVWERGRRLQPGTEARSAQQIVDDLEIDPELPTAVIFAHVLWDGSLFYGEDLFANYADWLVQSVAAAAANPHVNWIVKTHPSNLFFARRGYASPESSELALLQRALSSPPRPCPHPPSGDEDQHAVALRLRRLRHHRARNARPGDRLLRQACIHSGNRHVCRARLHLRLEQRAAIPRAACDHPRTRAAAG